jgi:trigger factor
MERELAGVIRGRVRVAVLDALYKDNPVDVPRAMIDEQVQELQVDTARRLGIQDARALPPRERFEEPARRRAALGLLISRIVEAEDLKVERERVQSRLAELIESYPDPDQARRAYLQNQDAMRQIEASALEEQAIDWILARAKVSEQPSTFKELTGFGGAGTGQDLDVHDHAHHGHDHEHGHEHGQQASAAGGEENSQVGGK